MMRIRNIIVVILPLLLIPLLAGNSHAQIAPGVSERTSTIASPSSDTIAARWLRRAEAEIADVPRLPADFPRRPWIQWMVQSYLDLNRPDDALQMTLRNEHQFNVDRVRDVIYYMSSRLAANGEHAQARRYASLLANGMPENIHVRNPSQHISLMIDITARLAERGDFSEAITTANMIPKNNWPFERARAFRAIGVYSARQGNLDLIRKIEHEFPPRIPQAEYYATLAFALSRAGAFDSADAISRQLPSSLQQAVMASKSVDLADRGLFEEAQSIVDQLVYAKARQALLERLLAVMTWRDMEPTAREVAEKAERHDRESAFEAISKTRAWMSKPADGRVNSSGDSSYFAYVSTLMHAFPPAEKRDGGVDPFEAYANFPVQNGIYYDTSGVRTLDDVNQRIIELTANGWNRESINEGINRDGSSSPTSDSVVLEKAFVNLTALTAVAESVGDQQIAGRLAADGLKIASRLGFRQHSLFTTYLLVTAAKNGHVQQVLSVLAQTRTDAIPYEARSASSFDDSTLPGKVAFAFAVTGQQEHVEAMLKNAPTASERSLICLGAARGTLAVTRPVKFLPVIGDKDQLLSYMELPNDPVFWAEANGFKTIPTYFRGQYR